MSQNVSKGLNLNIDLFVHKKYLISRDVSEHCMNLQSKDILYSSYLINSDSLYHEMYADECFEMSLWQNKESDFNNEQNNNLVIR